MRPGRVFGAASWKSAIGELLLIVVGVTIALAASSWYEDRQERRKEKQVLEQLRQALEVDLQEFRSRHQTQNRVYHELIALTEHMTGTEPYDPEVAPYFTSVLTWVGVRSNTAPYQALKSTGLDLISSDLLRLKLIYYYENQVTRLHDTYINNRAFATERAAPYFYSNFRNIASSTYVPDDYEKLRSDKFFWNLCMTKINRLQRRILPSYEQTIEMNLELLAYIEAELGD
jgi:type II secretory pathway pseudopilin PulG